MSERGRESGGRRGAAFLIVSFTFVSGMAAAAFSQDKAAAPPVTAASALKIAGYTQILSTVQKTGTDGFSLRRARFGLSGELSKTLKFKAEFEALKSPAVIDAQIDWTPSAAAGLRVGQFKVPFSLENMTPTPDLDFINLAQAVARLVPGQDNGSSGRDVGLAFNGKASAFEYYVGVFNGAGINKADTNDHKDVAARLVVRPAAGLSFGASVYDGRHSAAAGAAPVARDRVGFEAAWVAPRVQLKAELICAKDAAVRKQGWYAQAGYFLVPKSILALVRYDTLDVNREAASDSVDVVAAGFVWIIAGRTKLQVNYEHSRGESGAVLNRAALAQLQVGF